MQNQRVTQTKTTTATRQRELSSYPRSLAAASPHPILQLQQTIGNQAVQHVLRSRMIQPKLAISQPGDTYEQEADRIAEEVMRMPEPAIQRICSACAAGGSTCTECETEDDGLLQRKAAQRSGRGGSVPDDFIRNLGPGESLDPATRTFFEPRFGSDFGHVRVHTDASAAQSARAVGAVAYTVGSNIVFAGGKYDPGGAQGRKLLAHELAHTIQQSADAAGTPMFGSERCLQRAPDDASESEIQSYVFAGDKRLSTDKDFARRSGQEIAARMRKSGKLSRDLRLELNGMLAFFQGDAKDLYIQEIKPTLEQVTKESGAEEAFRDPTAFFERMVKHPQYIDNDMKLVSFFTAELARIQYHDGASLDLGLVPRWMEPPFEEVDYHTPRQGFRLFHNPPVGSGFIREEDLHNVPRSMSFAEIQRRYYRPVEFLAHKSGRIVPNRVNALTAPQLCKILLDSEKQYTEQVRFGAQFGTQVAGVVMGMGAGGFPARSMVEAEVAQFTARMASRRAATRAVKILTEQMDDLFLKAGKPKMISIEGVEFAEVQLARQGDRLAVSRYSTTRVNAPPGHGAVMNEAFEDAAVAVARMRGLKSVTINVGKITNPAWREWLESIGYVKTMIETAEGVTFDWVKTIAL